MRLIVERLRVETPVENSSKALQDLVLKWSTDTQIDSLSVALAIRSHPLFGLHPVPFRDTRTKGFLIDKPCAEAKGFLQENFPEILLHLSDLVPPSAKDLVFAATELPPGQRDEYALRPHVDRRWLGDGFDSARPCLATIVLHLDVPRPGNGGELVLILNERRLLFEPVAGRLWNLPPELVHGVMNYTESAGDPWRLSVVLAAF